MVPELDVSDFSESLKFYTEILGFQVLYARHDPEFVYLEQEDLQFMLIQEKDKNWIGSTLEKPYGRGVNLQMELEDIQPVYERLINHNIALYRDIKDEWREAGNILAGQRKFWIQDPDGYLLRFCQPLEDKPLRNKQTSES
jgi:catechol 2,3-dioxygenase-like lactoylglutathione lyase family enzyme